MNKRFKLIGLLILMIFININCIVMFTMCLTIVNNGYILYNIPGFIYPILIIFLIPLFLAIILSFIINFVFFIQYYMRITLTSKPKKVKK